MNPPLDTPLSRLRLERGMTQADLAAASGLNQATIARLEAGRVSPKASTIVTVAEALDIDPVDYFGAVCGLKPKRPVGLISTRQAIWHDRCRDLGENAIRDSGMAEKLRLLETCDYCDRTRKRGHAPGCPHDTD